MKRWQKKKGNKFLANTGNLTQTNTCGFFILTMWQILLNKDVRQIINNQRKAWPDKKILVFRIMYFNILVVIGQCLTTTSRKNGQRESSTNVSDLCKDNHIKESVKRNWWKKHEAFLCEIFLLSLKRYKWGVPVWASNPIKTVSSL